MALINFKFVYDCRIFTARGHGVVKARTIAGAKVAAAAHVAKLYETHVRAIRITSTRTVTPCKKKLK